MIPLLLLLTADVDIPCKGEISGDLGIFSGERIHIGAGDCSISTPVVFKKPTTIICAGEGQTNLRAQRGGFGALARLRVEDCRIWRADMLTETATRAIGINASAPVELEHVTIEGFTIGIYIYASVSDFGTNANAWRMGSVTVRGSAHAGVLVRGRDSNAGVAAAIRAQTNCERSTIWEKEFGGCAGIVDRSFLGNTWIAPVLSTNGERTSGGFMPLPPFASVGSSQHSVWVGVYCERDQAAALTDQGTIVLGGLCTKVSGDGLRVDGTALSGLEIINAKDPANVVRFRAGARAASGTFFELASDAIDGSRPLRVKAEPAKKCYRFDIANQVVPLRIGQDGSFSPMKQ